MTQGIQRREFLKGSAVFAGQRLPVVSRVSNWPLQRRLP
jgi:hypothetical protein